MTEQHQEMQCLVKKKVCQATQRQMGHTEGFEQTDSAEFTLLPPLAHSHHSYLW